MSDLASRTLIVVPAWNEEVSVGTVVSTLIDAGHTVLVVDDGSSDLTGDVARAAGATVVRLPVNLGVGAALRCGFRWAVENGFEAVVQVDADGQHPVEAIDALLDAMEETGADLVIGSRFAGASAGMEVGIARRFAMRVLGRSASRAVGTTISDATSGFRVIRQPLLGSFAKSFPSHYLGDTYEAYVSAGRAGFDVREIAVEMRPRQHGQSSASPLAAIRFLARSMIVAGARLHFPLAPRPDPA